MASSRRKLAFLALLTSLMATIHQSTAEAGEIHRLLEEGKIEKAKALLLENPKLLELKDEEYQQTPLHIAAHRGHVSMVRFLLDRGAKVDARAYNRFTPLHLAEKPSIVKLLIENKADLEARNVSDRTALEEAANRFALGRKVDDSWRQVVKLLLDAGAYYDVHSAIYLGDVKRVRVLLEANPKLGSSKDLMRAAAGAGRAAIVKLLLDYKADPEDADYGGLPVLYFALGYPDVVRILLQAGANPRVRVTYHGNGWGPQDSTLLHEAASAGYVETAKLLLEAGAPVDGDMDRKSTPLLAAAWRGQPKMVKFLLENKASVRGKIGRDAMAVAAFGIRPPDNARQREENARYQAVIDILHAQGIPIDFFTAIAVDQVERVRELLKQKPELARSQDFDGSGGKLALTRAVDLDHLEIVALLLDAHAPINGKNQDGYTALHAAAFWGREKIAKLLIERKADVDAITNNGDTPLDESVRLNTPGVARLLLAAGAKVNAKAKKPGWQT